MKIPKVNLKRPSLGSNTDGIGQTPGTLIYTGKRINEHVSIEVFSFDSEEYFEFKSTEISDCLEHLSDDRVNWINVDGLSDVNKIKSIGETFSLHPLMLEDVVNVEQRPKFEIVDGHVFFTIKMFHVGSSGMVEYEHLSFLLGKNMVISFQETPEDVFNILRDRLRTGFGKMRQRKVDYLFYRLLDIIVDNYYLVLDYFAERIELLEDEVMENPSVQTLQKLQGIRKELIYLRRSVYPLREGLSALIKEETPLLRTETERYLSDVYDHTIHVIESLETYRDLLGGIMDLYMNSVSNKMNEIMKVLTIMASIFIPLTFIAGIYGMNFENMPELKNPHGYGLAWGAMLLVALGMIFYFKRKKWL